MNAKNMQFKVKINLFSLVGACLALLVTFSIFNGTAQEVINFSGVLNEMATAFTAFILALVLTALSFEKIK